MNSTCVFACVLDPQTPGSECYKYLKVSNVNYINKTASALHTCKRRANAHICIFRSVATHAYPHTLLLHLVVNGWECGNFALKFAVCIPRRLQRWRVIHMSIERMYAAVALLMCSPNWKPIALVKFAINLCAECCCMHERFEKCMFVVDMRPTNGTLLYQHRKAWSG